jgi:hypothetical protein
MSSDDIRKNSRLNAALGMIEPAWQVCAALMKMYHGSFKNALSKVGQPERLFALQCLEWYKVQNHMYR